LQYRLTLFGTSACHLCEQAEELILASLTAGTYGLNKVDIAADEELLAKYGAFIPVLEQEGRARTLSWPFDKEKLLHFLTHPES